jgi:hypothetical protein
LYTIQSCDRGCCGNRWLAWFGERYRYCCDTGPLGAKWFFKAPNFRDPWGIRVSVHSLTLAKYGMGWVRHYIHDTLATLGTEVSGLKMAISRVDYAVDFLAPDFILVPEPIVCHARANQKGHKELEPVVENGHSGRYTSVTIGKNPNRQVIIYDKREEVLNKSGKVVWWEIWNAVLATLGLPPLERHDPTKSRIWRVELRAYKRNLKDQWQIRTWEDFDTRGGDMFQAMLEAIRHTTPTDDTNRSRWPNSPLWNRVTAEVTHDLAELMSDVPPDRFKEVLAAKQKDILLGQTLGLVVSMAGLERVKPKEFAAHFANVVTACISQVRFKF